MDRLGDTLEEATDAPAPRRRSRGAEDAAPGTDGVSFSRRALVKAIGMGSIVPTSAVAGRVTAEATEGQWTIVALPDTQKYAESGSGLLEYAEGQTQWIADNLGDYNVAFVTHLGDLVENGDDADEWDRIAGVMDTIDGAVPYSTLPGNHDWATTGDKTSSIQNFKDNFGIPSGRYDSYSWFRGFGPDSSDHNANVNSWQTFDAGGYTFLHIALEWDPADTTSDPTPLEWAQGVLDANPDKPAIVTTHEYLDDETQARTSRGDAVWDELVRTNPQVFLVMCGHMHNRPDGDPDDGEHHQTSTNAAGLEVYEVLANYQDRTNGGDGWFRRYEFLPGGGSPDRLRAVTFKPDGTTETDSESAFSFDFDFDTRFDSSNWTKGTATFQQGADGYAGTVDTNVKAGEPDRSFGSEPTLVVDTTDGSSGDQPAHALLRFEDVVGDGDGQVPSGATIESATLTVQSVDGTEDGADLHRMVSGWSDANTWNDLGGDGVQADGAEAAGSPDASIGPIASGATEIDVTTSVQAWADGESNHGWAVLPKDVDGWDFESAEGGTPPALEVSYLNGPGGGGSASLNVDSAAPTDVEATAATLNGDLTSLGGASSADVWFTYWEQGNRSSTEATTTKQTLSSEGPFQATISGLTPETSYEFLAHVDAVGDTDQGHRLSFPTPAGTATFQEGADGYAGTVDTNVKSGQPDQSFGSETAVVVDSTDDGSGGGSAQALLRFEDVVGDGDGQVPSGATIESATLTLESLDGSKDGVDAHRMLQSWDETATWNDFGGDGVQADGTEAATFVEDSPDTSSTGPTEFDVTASVQAWVDGEPNHGWVFLPGGGDGWDFATSEHGSEPRPRLSVVYNFGDDGLDLPGNVDGDGDVDEDDVELVRRHIAGQDVDMNESRADIDGDGDVDIVDAMGIKNNKTGGGG